MIVFAAAESLDTITVRPAPIPADLHTGKPARF
jgi:hypothetical protein